MSSEINPASSVLRPTITRDPSLTSECKEKPLAIRRVSAVSREPIQRIGSFSSAGAFKTWGKFPDSSKIIRYHPPTREMTEGLYDLCSSGKSHQAEPKRHRWELKLTELGSGSFATTHPMVEVRTGKPCVGKINFPTKKAYDLAQKEYQNLRQWQGVPHIVRVLGAIAGPSHSQKTIVMERAEPCLLNLTLSQKIPFQDIVSIFRQFLEMHREAAARGLIHGDLKPHNAAYKNGKLTIYDLGLASTINNRVNGGTLRYAAPEVFLGKYYDSSRDLWSIGAIIYEIFAGTFFVQEGSNGEICLQQIVDQIGLPSHDYFKNHPHLKKLFKLNNPPTLHGILTSEALKRGLSERTTARFIGLLSGILRFEGRVSADTALELCNQICRELNQTIAPSEEKKS